MKSIIFDSSSLISLAMNALFGEIRELKKAFKGKFIITREVKDEIIDKALKIRRFKLEGLKLKQLLDDGVLELPDALGVSDVEIAKKTKKILKIANSTFIGKDGNIKLIDSGEASCLALGSILNEKKIVNVLAVDERTTRMLCEKPNNLIKLLKRKMHTTIKPRRENYEFFKGHKIIRSAELVYIAWKKGIVDLDGKETLDALLWGVRFKGCSISNQEIREIEGLG